MVFEWRGKKKNSKETIDLKDTHGMCTCVIYALSIRRKRQSKIGVRVCIRVTTHKEGNKKKDD